MVEEPNPHDVEHSESADALAGAWVSLSEAKGKRRLIRQVAAQFVSGERTTDFLGDGMEQSMRPKP